MRTTAELLVHHQCRVNVLVRGIEVDCIDTSIDGTLVCC